MEEIILTRREFLDLLLRTTTIFGGTIVLDQIIYAPLFVGSSEEAEVISEMVFPLSFPFAFDEE